MSNNLKTWPEKIYLQNNDDPKNAYQIGDDVTWCLEQINDSDVKYIRADIAKEREAKLIKTAMYYCDSLSEVKDVENAAKLLYEKAGIEELE